MIVNLSLFFITLTRVLKDDSEKNIEKVKYYSKKCGPLAIKLLQFISTRTGKLRFSLEDCEVHSFEQTKKLYFQDFGHDISDDYTFDSEVPIGSGSIGQVYKLYSLHLNKYVAMKVKHPNIDASVHKFSRIIKIFLYLFKWFISFHQIIKQFINNIQLQLDYSFEVQNTKKMYDKFKNESCVIIPEIYDHRNNFIIMSYHDGIPFEQSPNKIKVSLYVTFVTLTSILVNDYLHSDLHNGNWKVTDDFNIIIYDCGMAYSTNNLNFNKQVMSCLFTGNFEKLLYISNPNNCKKKILKCIETVRKNSKSKKNATARMLSFVNEAIKLKLVTDINSINLLTAYAMVSETVSVSANIFTEYVYHESDNNAVMLYSFYGILLKLGIFNDLKDYIKDWLDSDPNNSKVYTDWLMDKFGHTDAESVCSSICDLLV